MAEFPALTLWTDSYLSDTRTLTTLEHGAYLLLLMEAWRRPHCDLPDDDRLLARMVGLRPDEWAEIKPIVMDFWTLDGRSKTWRQKRLTKERDAARRRSGVAKDKAAKRWNKKDNADAGASTQQCSGDATTATAIITEEEPSGSSPPVSPTAKPKGRASGLPAEWQPNLTPGAQRVVDAWPPGMLEREMARFRDHAADKGRTSKDWQAAFRTWITKADEYRQQNTRPTGFAPRDNRDGFTRALDDRAGLGDPAGASGEAQRRAAGDGRKDGQLAPARLAANR